MKVHRIVAKHFLPDYSEDLTVNHKNYNKFDNRVENLEMLSLIDNIKDRANRRFAYYCPETDEYIFRPQVWMRLKGLNYNRYRLLQACNSGNAYMNTDYHFKYIDIGDKK